MSTVALKSVTDPAAAAAVQSYQTLKNPTQAATSAAALSAIAKTPAAGSVRTDATFTKLNDSFQFSNEQAVQVRGFLSAVRDGKDVSTSYDALKAVVTNAKTLRTIIGYAQGDFVPAELVAKLGKKEEKAAAKALIKAFLSNKQNATLVFLADKLLECEAASTYSARAKSALSSLTSKFKSTATAQVPAEENTADDVADVEENVDPLSFKVKAGAAAVVTTAVATAFFVDHYTSKVAAFKACEAARRFYSASCGVQPTAYQTASTLVSEAGAQISATASNLVAQATPYVAPVLAKGSAVMAAVAASPYTVPVAVAAGTVGAAALAYRNRGAIKTAYFYGTLTAGAIASKVATKAQNVYAAARTGISNFALPYRP